MISNRVAASAFILLQLFSAEVSFANFNCLGAFQGQKSDQNRYFSEAYLAVPTNELKRHAFQIVLKNTALSESDRQLFLEGLNRLPPQTGAVIPPLPENILTAEALELLLATCRSAEHDAPLHVRIIQLLAKEPTAGRSTLKFIDSVRKRVNVVDPDKKGTDWWEAYEAIADPGPMKYGTQKYRFRTGQKPRTSPQPGPKTQYLDQVAARKRYEGEKKPWIRLNSTQAYYFEKTAPVAQELAFLPRRQKNLILDSYREQPRPRALREVAITSSMTHEQRFDALKHVSIAESVGSGGHDPLRSMDAVKSIAFDITHGVFKSSGTKPILNIVTNEANEVLEVDIWDGHHRLGGFLGSGKREYGELKSDDLTILVNGMDDRGVVWEHLQPVSGIDLRRIGLWKQYLPGETGLPYRIQRWPNGITDFYISGKVPNSEIAGVRYYFGYIYQNMMDESAIQVGVLSDQHLDTADQRSALYQSLSDLERQGYTDIVLLPASSESKQNLIEFAKRFNRDQELRNRELRVNVYIADSGQYIERYGKASFGSRIQQAYRSNAKATFLSTVH